jgi:hypothetical protein
MSCLCDRVGWTQAEAWWKHGFNLWIGIGYLMKVIVILRETKLFHQNPHYVTADLFASCCVLAWYTIHSTTRFPWNFYFNWNSIHVSGLEYEDTMGFANRSIKDKTDAQMLCYFQRRCKALWLLWFVRTVPIFFTAFICTMRRSWVNKLIWWWLFVLYGPFKYSICDILCSA